MQSSFPKPTNQFLKAEQFQDQEIPLTFKGWEKKSNIDRVARDGKSAISWKQCLKYTLRFSYPEFAIDEAGERKTDAKGKPIKNRNYDPDYPQGYSIKYIFEEGILESGSLPLWNAFCFVNPKPGEKVLIKRTGALLDTEWKVKKIINTESNPLEVIINDEFPDEIPQEEPPF